MRTTLERAMGRASSTLSPGHRHFAAQVLTLLLLNQSAVPQFSNYFSIFIFLLNVKLFFPF